MPSSPDLSVCIVNWNTREDLGEAIASVLASGREVSLQLVVLDNASQDGSAEMVRERFPEVTLIQSAENLGFARGYNRAAARSSGRHLLMLNPDTVVHSGALARLVAFLDSEPSAGAAGPRLLNLDGSLQYSCRRFPTPMAALLRNTVLGRLAPHNHYTRDYLMADWEHDAVRPVDWISGAAMCIRRQAWEQIGGFDEGYFMYAEDMDWCWRAREAGWQVYYVPDAVIMHHIGRSSDQRPFTMVVAFHRSAGRFYRKHYAPKWPWALRTVPILGLWSRAGLVMLQTILRRGRDCAVRLLRRSA
jgi:GT2 family glycosyltransferase